MLNLNHLRHPLRAAAVAKARIGAYLDVRRAAERIQLRYGADPRFDLESVPRGLADRIRADTPVELASELAMLQRICSAYHKAVEDQSTQPAIYLPTECWQQVRIDSLGPVLQALQTWDLHGLRSMYRNLFRDPCSAGLVDMPNGMAKALCGAAITDLYRRFYLGDALHRIDTWAKQVGNGYSPRNLAGPGIGNPFGIFLDGTLIQSGAPYQHYCSFKIIRQLISDAAVVAEIGGGYGGMAYYLLRDRPRLTYLDFDLPESLALTAYYLYKAFPRKALLLYGEQELSRASMQHADILLMPLFELHKLPQSSVHVSFSSRGISDLARESLAECLRILAGSSRDFFFHIGSVQAARMLSDEILRGQLPFRLVESRASSWYTFKYAQATEVECLYRAGD